MTAIALTIAGSDSGGGAGIQADLKTFSACGVYGASVLTALTAQNTLGVTAIHDVPVDFIRAQMDAVFDDLAVNAVKIGMLSQSATIEAVADGLTHHKPTAIVLDPVMVAESGDPLLAQEAETSLVTHLFPIAHVITPNLHEAARLLNTNMASSRQEMEDQARRLIDMGARSVLLKGGHSKGADAEDCYLTGGGSNGDGDGGGGEAIWYSAPFINTKNTHGTGCSLSSAIAAHLALGCDLPEAIRRAKAWLSEAIAHADSLQIGSGAGPVHHFHKFWD
ncbi:MAG: bifunctional hydroxymethylpyrimidine kinase/phosphomethylpyrimidine kinase [Rhizobiaceae bacterium]